MKKVSILILIFWSLVVMACKQSQTQNLENASGDVSLVNSANQTNKILASYNGQMPPLHPVNRITLTNETNAVIKKMITDYKQEARGPYQILNWYCDDGSIHPANTPCGAVGGVQRATYKPAVKQLGEQHHVFLGQILATTDKQSFLDEAYFFSRMKQYQLEKYLRAVDDGWVNRKAQFYRGAVQAEDEENWGKAFFEWVLANDQMITEHFFLLREAVRDIPHSGDTNIAQKMRSESKSVADAYPAFAPLRIKIHGRPEPADIEAVKKFQTDNKAKLSSAVNKKLNDLEATMTDYFSEIDATEYQDLVGQLSNEELKNKLNEFLTNYQKLDQSAKLEQAAKAMWTIRESILSEKSPKARLTLLDLSLKIEHLIKNSIYRYPVNDLGNLTQQIKDLTLAAAASGCVELWEVSILQNTLNQEFGTASSLGDLSNFLLAGRNVLEWGTSKNGAIFSDVVTLYEGFEPKAVSFIDDRIRSSVLLELGNSIGQLGQIITEESSLNNEVLNIPNQSHIHGLNPGFAKGKLYVIKGSDYNVSVEPNNIYVFEQAPSDLKPVAGIMTVSEGNLVSHVQLLARNLGIPNAAISQNNFQELQKHNGEEVFYAVSNKGNVIMKDASQMTAQEKALVKKEVQKQEMITINTEALKLNETKVLNLRDVDASFSGNYCGPKAANMGELKKLFPDHVVEGMVIPFGIFMEHMKQNIPNEQISYWTFLNNIFEKANQMKAQGQSAKAVENYELKQLNQLREYIRTMPLLPSFKEDLEHNFQQRFGKPVGEIGVFLRSDTNMEDLGNFTGAGLNLTLFNVRLKEHVFNGIKEVWASPYTEEVFSGVKII